MCRQPGMSKVEAAQGPFTAPLDGDARDHLIGRRDMLVGLWAGELLGLPEESRATARTGDGSATGRGTSSPQRSAPRGGPSAAIENGDGKARLRLPERIDARGPGHPMLTW